MSEPTFKNACDYHIAQPSSLATSSEAAAAKRSASCRACSIECSLQKFGKADRAECLQSCDPSPVAPGQGATDGAQYPDPLLDEKFDEIRDTYVPRVTALTCPSSSCSDGVSESKEACDAANAVWTAIDDNNGKFAGSVKCRPFTDAIRDEVLAAATESAMDGCGAMKSRGFSCDLDCDSLDYDQCLGESDSFCKWTGDGTCNIQAKLNGKIITDQAMCNSENHTWKIRSSQQACMKMRCSSGLDEHPTQQDCEADGFEWKLLPGDITDEAQCTAAGHQWRTLTSGFCMEREDTTMTENQCRANKHIWMLENGRCTTRTAESSRAINMCSTGDDACADGSAMLSNTAGQPCTILGSNPENDKDGVYGFDEKGIFRCIAAPARLNACPDGTPFC